MAGDQRWDMTRFIRVPHTDWLDAKAQIVLLRDRLFAAESELAKLHEQAHILRGSNDRLREKLRERAQQDARWPDDWAPVNG